MNNNNLSNYSNSQFNNNLYELNNSNSYYYPPDTYAEVYNQSGLTTVNYVAQATLAQANFFSQYTPVDPRLVKSPLNISSSNISTNELKISQTQLMKNELVASAEKNLSSKEESSKQAKNVFLKEYKILNDLEKKGIELEIKELQRVYQQNKTPENKNKLLEAQLIELSSCYQIVQNQLNHQQGRIERRDEQITTLKRKRDEDDCLLSNHKEKERSFEKNIDDLNNQLKQEKKTSIDNLRTMLRTQTKCEELYGKLNKLESENNRLKIENIKQKEIVAQNSELINKNICLDFENSRLKTENKEQAEIIIQKNELASKHVNSMLENNQLKAENKKQKEIILKNYQTINNHNQIFTEFKKLADHIASVESND